VTYSRIVNKLAAAAHEEIQRRAALARLELQRIAETHNRSRGQLFRRNKGKK